MEFFKLIFAKSEIKKLKYLKINKILNETQMPIIKNNFIYQQNTLFKKKLKNKIKFLILVSNYFSFVAKFHHFYVC